MIEILHIKNMVCARCRMAVEKVLKGANIEFVSIVLGKAVLVNALSPEQKTKVKVALKHYELELMEHKIEILVEQIKTEIISLLHSHDNTHLKLSVYLSNALGYNYTYLANTFSDQEGKTLEHYFINQRVERAKEMMMYECMSLTDIAENLGYSSVSHFCVQFRKVVGITPAAFKKFCHKDNFVWRTLT